MNNDLFAANLTKGVEDPADGKVKGDEMLGPAGKLFLLALALLNVIQALGVQMLEVSLGEIGDPFGQMRVQQLGQLLKRIKTLNARLV